MEKMKYIAGKRLLTYCYLNSVWIWNFFRLLSWFAFILREKETQSRHAQPLVLEGSTQQAAFIVAAAAPMTTYMPSRRHTAAAAARNPLAAFSISRLKGPKSLSAVVLERLSSANSLFSCCQHPCRHPSRGRCPSLWPRHRPWQPFHRSQPSQRLKEVV